MNASNFQGAQILEFSTLFSQFCIKETCQEIVKNTFWIFDISPV